MIEKLEVLIGLAQLVGHCPANQKVTGSILCQGTCLGYRPGPPAGGEQEVADGCFSCTSMFLSFSLSLLSPLSKKIHK